MPATRSTGDWKLIHSRVNHLLGVVFHESTGSFSIEDAMHALVRNEELGRGQCAVVWDLRKTDADSFDQKLHKALLDALNSKVIAPSVHSRAIVAKNSTSLKLIEHLVNELPVPWSWIVTTSLGEAVAWVAHHHHPSRD